MPAAFRRYLENVVVVGRGGAHRRGLRGDGHARRRGALRHLPRRAVLRARRGRVEPAGPDRDLPRPDPAQLRHARRGRPRDPRHRRPRGRPHAGARTTRRCRTDAHARSAFFWPCSPRRPPTPVEVARERGRGEREDAGRAELRGGRHRRGGRLAAAGGQALRQGRAEGGADLLRRAGRVSADGKAEEVVFGPETAVARCVAPDFRDAAYPRPPKPDWWVRIEVQLK